MAKRKSEKPSSSFTNSFKYPWEKRIKIEQKSTVFFLLPCIIMGYITSFINTLQIRTTKFFNQFFKKGSRLKKNTNNRNANT